MITHTQTITLARPLAPITAPQRSVGHVLGRAAQEEERPLPSSREGFVRGRLERLMICGREAKIVTLLEALSTVEGAEEWMEEFRSIDLENSERRARFLAICVINILNPNHLFKLRELVDEILQSLLPPQESVSKFLDNCEEKVREKKLLDERCAREREVAESYMAALRSTAAQMDDQMDSSCDLLKRRLLEIQESCIDATEEIQSEVSVLMEKVNQLQIHVCSQAAAISTTGTEEEKQLNEILGQCEALMERLV